MIILLFIQPDDILPTVLFVLPSHEVFHWWRQKSSPWNLKEIDNRLGVPRRAQSFQVLRRELPKGSYSYLAHYYIQNVIAAFCIMCTFAY